MKDVQYKNPPFSLSEIAHDYGENIHILSDPYMLLGLSSLCSPQTKQPLLHYWVSRLYRSLLQAAVNSCFERARVVTPTRMAALHPEAVVEAELPNPESKVVVVNLARAGTVPSFVCYDELNYFLNPDQIRQDHIILNRQTDAKERVTGARIGGSKIGGDIDDCYVLLPDPMGATGSTLKSALEAYGERGRARKWIAMHLIVTPEYVRTVQKLREDSKVDLEVFALRLDRGLSTPAALKAKPGAKWAEEKGLNEKGYIVPGAGGLGEILNNAFI